MLIGLLGQHRVHVARTAEGPRQARIEKTGRLFNVFPGGRVPAFRAEIRVRMEAGPFVEPDSPGLLLVKGAPGIDELASQLEAYHYEHKVTDTKDEMVVARIDEDMVAALEYGIEELEEARITLAGQTIKSASVSYGRPVMIS